MGGIAYCRGCLPPSDTHRILAKVLQFCWRPGQSAIDGVCMRCNRGMGRPLLASIEDNV